MNTVIRDMRAKLKKSADEKTKISSKRFFREAVMPYGVKSAVVGRIAKEGFQVVSDRTKKEIFGLCEELWRSGYLEESFIACEWAYRLNKCYTFSDMSIFDRWVNKYVNNWASCDTFCNHAVGALLEMYPACFRDLKKWARSGNRWARRAAAVSLIIPARRGKFLKDVFEIADALLLDPDDMVQKGYGWMLKAASEAHQREVFNYVMKHKVEMPRTALRYAIEKMPAALKRKAMQK